MAEIKKMQLVLGGDDIKYGLMIKHLSKFREQVRSRDFGGRLDNAIDALKEVRAWTVEAKDAFDEVTGFMDGMIGAPDD